MRRSGRDRDRTILSQEVREEKGHVIEQSSQLRFGVLSSVVYISNN